MKKEMLRIQDMCCGKASGHHLDHISLCLLEGEITGLSGLAGSGKDLLVDILTGEETYEHGFAGICGMQSAGAENLAEAVYKIVDSNYRIEEWTVAEYIGLVTNKSSFGILRRKRLANEIQNLFTELALSIDVHSRLRNLTEVEKRLVDIAKACMMQVKVLIIEDEFEGFSVDEIVEFKKELKRLIHGRMAAVINNHSDMITGLMAEKLIIFKKGRIVKKCRRDDIKNPEELETFLLGTSIQNKKHILDRQNIESVGEKEQIYQVKNVAAKIGKCCDFIFRRGEIVTILVLDRKEKETIFGLISGRIDKQGVIRILGEETCGFHDISDFVRSRIVSAVHLGAVEELLPSMSVGENLLVPSLNKISALEYTKDSHRLVKMLEKGIVGNGVESNEQIGALGINDRIALTLERWHVFNPRVLVLLEPFAQCDTYGVSLVKSYIKKIASGGTCVVVVKSREEYMEELSDRFINI